MLTTYKANKQLPILQIYIVGNSYIDVNGLNRGGLPLDETITVTLALSFIKNLKF